MSEKKTSIPKKILKVILWILAIIVVALLALPLWIGPVVKGVANWKTPQITGCKFNLGEFGLNQYTGEIHVGDMQLANPPGTGDGNCVELNKFYANAGMLTLLSQKVHITEVTLDGLVVSTSITGENFRKIASNAKAVTKEEEPEAKPEEKPAEEAPKGEGKRFVIDKLTIANLKVILSGMPIAIPDMTIEGIGADEPDGASAAEVWNAIFSRVKDSLGSVGAAIGDLGKGAAKIVGDTAGNAIEAVKNVDVSGAVDAVNEGVSALSDKAGGLLGGAGAAGDAAAESVKAAGDAAVDSAKAAGAAVKDGASAVGGKVMDGASAAGSKVMDGASAAGGAVVDGAKAAGGAVMDGAGAAVDSIKGLFKSGK